jgi:hypothetical protein
MPRNRQLNNIIRSEHLRPDAVVESDVKDLAVTTAKIANLNVTTGKIAADAVTNDKLGPHQKKHLTFSADVNSAGVGVFTMTDASGGAQTIPDNAIITAVVYEKSVSIGSAGSATIKLGVTGNDDAFIAATAFDNAAFTADVTALTNEVPLKLDGAKSVIGTVATAALNAGVFFVRVEYYEGA